MIPSSARDRPFECFPNYTWAMYNGNEPAGKGHELAAGGYADRWDCRYGDAETINGKIIHASFNIKKRVTLYLCRESLFLVENIGASVYQFCINHSGMPGSPCMSERNIHDMEQEKVVRYLNADIRDCLLWDMVNQRTKELCFAYTSKTYNYKKALLEWLKKEGN